MESFPWSPWHPLPEAGLFSESCLTETLDGGQAFRWNRQPDGFWLGQWGNCVCRLRRRSDGVLLWSAPQSLKETVARELPAYLAADQDWAGLVEQLPWRTDPHLADCVKRFPSLRILRQPLGETLLGFLCSATKQIVQIKQMCHQMALAFGQEIVPGFHALPDWAAIARASEEDLRRCGLGFRARYIKATSLLLADAPDRSLAFEQLPYPAARAELIRLPGVGEKVADCILLFGAGRLESFPVDVWILRVMENRYQLHGWTNPQIAHFGRMHFGHLAGLAQQFLFSSERQETKAVKKTMAATGKA